MLMQKEYSAEKFNALMEKVRIKGNLLVAFSGGVDSAVLVHIAKRVLGKNAHAVFVNDETVSAGELEHAKSVAEKLGIELTVLSHNALDEDFCKNTIQRCYHCKKSMIRVLKEFAGEHGIECIAMGVSASDLKEYRPGIRAGFEEGVWYPFLEHGITKEEIRAYAREHELEVSERPANACLASRVAYNQKITPELLRRIDEAERFIKSLGFHVVRVRVHGSDARIELGKDEMHRALSTGMFEKISAFLHALGFVHVSLDLDGYRPGSMNEGITQPAHH